MDSIIINTLKSLKVTYIIHIILFIGIFFFNFFFVSEIFWLKKILMHIYSNTKYIYIIFIIPPIISLILLLKNKITKNNVKIFKVIAIIFCTLAIIFGIALSAILMINAIEYPEFCKECPFNLPLIQINNINKESQEKCTERRCAKNMQNLNSNEKNENEFYEYICNYDPTSEFEQVKESSYSENNNNSSAIKSDNIICKEINKDNIEITNSLFENNFVSEFYYKCNSHTKFYICERSKAPNEYNLEDDFICPEMDYITKLVIFCILNVVINLICAFYPWKSQYNKYITLISCYQPRTAGKSNSFSSTVNSSKIQKDNIEEENFERSPTEIIIVYGNNSNNINNIDNEVINDKNKNCKKLKVDEHAKKSNNIAEIKITKNINVINNINIINNNSNKKEDIKEDDKITNINNIKRYNKKVSKNKSKKKDNKIKINHENIVTSTEKITLSSNKNLNSN